MKKLQNNFTTPDQSKRLLELGLPEDSADMYYQKTKQEDDYELFVGENMAIKENLFSYRYGYSIPCWSVGRLIEILRICVTDEDERVEIMENLIYWTLLDLRDFLLQTYQEYKDVIDFSKLEE